MAKKKKCSADSVVEHIVFELTTHVIDSDGASDLFSTSSRPQAVDFFFFIIGYVPIVIIFRKSWQVMEIG